jgi:NADP-dependent aldehyde dehydrogenase
MKLSGLSRIAGQQMGQGSERFVARAAEEGTPLSPDFVTASHEEIDAAAEHAEKARDPFGNTTGDQRARFLEAIAERIEFRVDDLVLRAGAETALPEPRIRMETGRAANQLRMFASIVREGSWVDARIDRADPNRQPPRPDVRSLRRPLGPVVVFCASNFPLAFSVAGGDTASALAAGNPVIVVAHPAHPGTAELVGDAIAEAAAQEEMPPGVFSLLQGRGEDVAPRLVAHPAISAVGFTGSRRGGLAIAEIAARRAVPIPVFAEMSRVNPIFFFEKQLESRRSALAEGLVGSMTLGGGQFCTNPGLLFAPKGSATDAFVAAVEERLAAAPGGTMLTSAIRENFDRAVQLRRESVASAGSADRSPAGPCLFRTDLETFARRTELSEEIFGPASLLVEWEDIDQLVVVAGQLEGQLTATIQAASTERSQLTPLLDVLEHKAGRLLWGGFPTGVEVCSSMVHGGPFPATLDGRTTSVGGRAIERFTRLVCYQDWPAEALPPELFYENPLGIYRMIEGESGTD